MLLKRMSRITATEITSTFLTGNLLEDAEGYDTTASADLYAKQCQEALSDVYPNAKITITHQEGYEPQAHTLMNTLVVFSDGSTQTPAHRGDAEIINDICEGVFNEQEWLVELAERA